MIELDFCNEISDVFNEKWLLNILYDYYEDLYVCCVCGRTKIMIYSNTYLLESNIRYKSNKLAKFKNINNICVLDNNKLIIVGDYLYVVGNTIKQYNLKQMILINDMYYTDVMQILNISVLIVLIKTHKIIFTDIYLNCNYMVDLVDKVTSRVKYYKDLLYYASEKSLKCGSLKKINPTFRDIIEFTIDISTFDILNDNIIIGLIDGSIHLFRNNMFVVSNYICENTVTAIVIDNDRIFASNNSDIFILDLNLKIMKNIKTQFSNISNINLIRSGLAVTHSYGHAIISLYDNSVLHI